MRLGRRCRTLGQVEAEPPPARSRLARSRSAWAAGAFVALAVLHTWPLATAPARLSRNDNADTILNEWIIAWVAHALPRDPLRLFDANIFYPERRTLAYSEHLFVPAVMASPALAAGASPVLAYNLLLLVGFALTGWTTSLVVTRWTGDRVAGIIAGSLMAFNAHTLTRLPHPQAIHAEFFPLTLLAFDRLIAGPTVATAMALAASFALLALTSNYLLVFAALALPIAALTRPGDWRGGRWRALLPRAGLAAVAAGLAILPFLLPYARVRDDLGLTRSLDEVALYSATWRDYLSTAARLHHAMWSFRFFEGSTALFPGVTALALAGAAIASGAAFRDPRARMCLAFGIAGVLLSFGPAVPGYRLLYAALPLMQGIRGAARFGWLGLAAIAILAGYGAAALRTRFGGRVWIAGLSFALVALVNVEALRAPMTFTPFSGIPPIYARLASEPGAVVVELPLYHPQSIARNAPYLLNSTRHWKPLVNGYSGFTPPGYGRRYEDLRGFPDARAISALRALGVTHVFVHTAEFTAARGPGAFAELREARDLELVGEGQGIRLYRLR